MSFKNLKKDLRSFASEGKRRDLSRFFKTGEGEYGEGDVFLGVMVPQSRKVALKYRDLPLKEVEALLDSKYHEERLVALLILVDQYKRGDDKARDKIFRFYLAHTDRINSWDLVDLSAHKIVGEHMRAGYAGRDRLYKLARSKSLWERRISIISTFAFIREGDLDDTFSLAEALLHDEHDLIHKAVGWVLREAGKKDKKKLVSFLKKHKSTMPRTTLRYAIEKFSLVERQKLMA